jgi:DNA topoisomerase-3
LSPNLYKDNGFLKEDDAKKFIDELSDAQKASVKKMEKKVEKKNPPMLFNLAELQAECSKKFKISPDETLSIAQELYEKKLTTYPRTDARVLSTAIATEIDKNLRGLCRMPQVSNFAAEILNNGLYKGIVKSKYTDDSKISDHYAIIPTGQGLQALKGMTKTAVSVYELIARRFLSIFYPPAVYEKLSIQLLMKHEKPAGQEGEPWQELFTANFKVLVDEGYLKVAKHGFSKKKNEDDEVALDAVSIETLKKIKKGDILNCNDLLIKEGKTSPPKRYNSGSMILAMESAGQLIEDEELRAQIKGSGIGTSATRAEILKKLININYIALNKKTQIITPTQVGEMVYEVVAASIYHLLNPELTASWEKGLTYVAQGEISEQEYMEKLNGFVTRRTMNVVQSQKQGELYRSYDEIAKFYK